MITKTLKTSGGDYSTLTAFWTAMKATYGVGNPMTDDVQLLVQAGTTFGSMSDYIIQFDNTNPVNFNSSFPKKVYIKTDPATIAASGPAVILGEQRVWSIPTSCGTPDVNYQNIAIMDSGTLSGRLFQLNAQTSQSTIRLTIDNCFLFNSSETAVARGLLETPTGEQCYFTLRNSVFIITGSSPANRNTWFGSSGVLAIAGIYNNILLNCSALNSNITLDRDTSVGWSSVNLKNNIFYCYANTSNTLTTNDTLTGLIVADPGFVAVPGSGSDTIATVITKLPGRSPGNSWLITAPATITNQADSATSTATDYLGTVRPQGAYYDRGAYEFPQTPILCWNYRARYKCSNKMYTANGAGKMPRELRVPGNVDINSGCMMDEGKLINPDQFRIIQ